MATTLSAILGLLYLLGNPAAAQTNTAGCRCTFGQPCWPSDADFKALSAQLSQPLVNILPAAWPCYTAPNSAACAAVRAGWGNGTWRADQIGAVELANFGQHEFPNGTIDACYIDTTLRVPCDQGNVPVVGADVRSVADVQAAVKFAVAHNLRTVVKNTGHDFLGRTSAKGAFMIWTHHLKNIAISDAFRPVGGSASETFQAVTLGSGVQWAEAYAALAKVGKELAGGFSHDGSVGAAAGWAHGGGHGPLAPRYGLGVDNILEVSLVLANGTAVTANAHQNTDLFWALRGGGGGTFGVTTSLTYRVYPASPLVGNLLSAVLHSPTPTPTFQTLVAEFVRRVPALSDAGWATYLFTHTAGQTLTFRMFALNPNATLARAQTTMGAFNDFTRALAEKSAGELEVLEAALTPYAGLAAWLADVLPVSDEFSGTNLEGGSWLLPRAQFEQSADEVARQLLTIPEISLLVLGGGAVNAVDVNATAVHPAWRKALALALFGTSWPEGASAAEIEEKRAGLRKGTATLRSLAPDSGAYSNEASLYEPDFRQSFWGTHYDRLKAIKNAVDPNGLFVVSEGVGSDDWDATLTCRK